MDAKYRARLPHIETDENGVKWMVSEAGRNRARRISRLQVRGRGPGAQQGWL